MVPTAPTVPAPHIADDLIHKSIVRAVQNVCSTMLKQDAGFVEKTTEPDRERFKQQKHVFGCVGFLGKIDGMVYLCITDDFAINAASRILGISTAEVRAEGDVVIKDVIGEITNMTVGGFKNALCDQGFTCKLTLPTIVRGENLSVSAMKSATRQIFHFDCDGQRLVADIQIKLS
jgi:chemotaxis protein CheX